jgi:hypothetical protein
MHHPFLSIITPASILVPIGAGIARYRVATAAIRTIFYFLIVTVIISLISILLIVYHRTNTAVIHADTIIESLFLLRFYYLVVKRPALRRWIRLTAILFPVLCLVNVLFLQSLQRHNTYTRPLEALIFIALSMYWWGYGGEDWLGAGGSEDWFVSGLLLYFSSAFFLFLFSNFLAEKYSLSVNILIWNIHASLTILMYLLFTIGFVKCKT